ncbi:hypothetical protein [Angustibacter sp. Root456]|uniref:hypothetical protein n=1 Tax=Angustibacter sp. Root456 TaxID=1736539 RepID=UPI0006F9FE03|nr:hypothetical protein [Angustibacter sp. Root456]KQX62044.1 hypothetical protein ASD06_16105 [Angustibacter sp. Root456]
MAAFPRSLVTLGVIALMVVPASVASATPSSGRPDATPGSSVGSAQRAAHGHRPDPTHVDPAPRGVDVHARVSTAEVVARSGVERRPARLAPRSSSRTGSQLAGDTLAADRPAVVLDVPAGVPGNPAITQHVSPSCTGTGTDGNRVQVLYAYEAGQADRLASIRASLQSYVADVDDTFALSSPNGNRRVRWVTSSSCVPDIRAVQVPVGSFGNTTTYGLDEIATAAEQAGIQTANRKLLTFADANGLCGIGEIYQDDSAAATNTNNTAVPMVARIDVACWSMGATGHSTPAHELMHMLGGVQESAPHSTTLGHCTDENDVMCYEDGGFDHAGVHALMTQVCQADADERLFDCGRDDYFNAGTPGTGSYLATHWNTAQSSYLNVMTTSISGPTSLRPGLAATYTATPSLPATVRWTATASGCLPATVTSLSIRVQCPSSYHGTLGLTATFTTSSGQQLVAKRSVSLSGPSAPLAVALSATSKVYTGYAATLSTSVKYGATPVRARLSAQYYSKVNGVGTWRTFATTTTSSTGTARFSAPRWTTIGKRYYRVVVSVGSGSGWTTHVSPTRVTYSIYRMHLTSGVRSGRPDLVAGYLRTSTGAPARYQNVRLQYRHSGSPTWHSLTWRKSSRTGRVAASVQPRRRTYYRWVYYGATYYGKAVSAQRYLRY